jgi:hypothetical protein
VGFRLGYFKNRGVKMKDFLIKGLKKYLQNKKGENEGNLYPTWSVQTKHKQKGFSCRFCFSITVFLIFFSFKLFFYIFF